MKERMHRIKYAFPVFFFVACTTLIAPLPMLRGAIYEAKIEETTISLSPAVEFMLPNGSIDVLLRHTLGRSVVDFSSKYDFIENYMYADLNFSYQFTRYYFGLDLSDNINFEEMLFGQNSLQRSRHMMPYVGYRLSKPTSIEFSTKFGSNYAVSIDNVNTLDSGKDVTPMIGIHYSTLEETTPAPKGTKISLDVSKSLSMFGGDYDYTQADFKMEDILYPYDGHYVRSKLRMGYPLAIQRKPLTEIYFLGGYELMRGYKYREFLGDSILYLQLDYNIPLPAVKSLFNGVFDVISWDMMWETGKTSTRESIATLEGFRSSFGAGTSCYLTLFKTVRTKFTMSVNQAVDMRNPVVYFSVSTLSYIRQ